MSRRTLRSKAYLEFVRNYNCLISETPHGVIAHHLRYHPHSGGMGLKPSDYRTVPLNQFLHRELHNIGEKTFWTKYGVCPEMWIADMLCDWLKERYAVTIPRIEAPDRVNQYIDAVENFIRDKER